MKCRPWALVLVWLAAGCVEAWRPLAPNALAALHPKTIALAVVAAPKMEIYPPYAVRGSMIGSIIAATEESKWRAELDDIESKDPAVSMGLRLARQIAQQQGLTMLPRIAIDEDAVDAPDYHGADLVLVTRTLNWRVNKFQADHDRYGVWYNARVALIAASTNQTLASGTCLTSPDVHDPSEAPSYTALMANHAGRVKRAIDVAEEKCVHRFERSLLASALPAGHDEEMIGVTEMAMSKTARPPSTNGSTSIPVDAQRVAADGVALRLAGALAASDFARTRTEFDQTMSTSLSAQAIAASWRPLAANRGVPRGMAVVTREMVPPFETRTVELRYDQSVIDVRVTTNSAGQVSGLFYFAGGQPYVPPTLPAGAHEIETTIAGPAIALPATFTVPAGVGPFPALVLVHGSGPNDRDETLAANRPFRDLAWLLAGSGIATLRYDKRTFIIKNGGKDKIDPATAAAMTVEDEVIVDALAALKAARARPEVKPDAVFVLGHSLGAQLTPEIVERDGQAAGGVMLGAPGRSLPTMVADQLAVMGAPAAKVDAARALAQRYATGQMAPSEPLMGVTAGYVADLDRRATPARARTLGKPLLLIWGGRDYQVTEPDRRIWQDGLQGADKISFQVFPKLNHLMIAGEQPSRPIEYQIPGTVAGEVIDAVVAFVRPAP